VFGDRPLTRDELGRLFRLFRQYGVVGLCTVEGGRDTEDIGLERSRRHPDSPRVREGRRLQPPLSGDRQIALPNTRSTAASFQDSPRRGIPAGVARPVPPLPLSTLFQAVKVFPSIHHVVAATEALGVQGSSAARDAAGAPQARPVSTDGGGLGGELREPSRFPSGIYELSRVLSPTLARNGVLAIVGERNTYKTPLSHHFLLHGLTHTEHPRTRDPQAPRGEGRARVAPDTAGREGRRTEWPTGQKE